MKPGRERQEADMVQSWPSLAIVIIHMFCSGSLGFVILSGPYKSCESTLTVEHAFIHVVAAAKDRRGN
jgi:hypothetical protein